MKSILVFALVCFACANAQGIDFLIDNIVDPAITQITDGTSGFLTNTIINLLLGWLINGKREVGVQQITQVISQVQSLFNNYKDKIDQIISGFSSQIQSLFNIFNLAGPARSHIRVEYLHKVGDVEILVKQESINLLNNLYQIFQQVFGQNFATLFGSNGRNVFGNVTTIINNLSTSISQFLENYGDSLLATATNISQLALPLLGNFQQQLTTDAASIFQHVQQIINQLQN